MTDLSKVGARNALKPKPDRTPHWQRLRPGLFLGYRPAADGAAGTWAVKVDPGKGKPRRQWALESYGELPERERFAKAQAAADKIMQREEAGGSSAALRMTVEEACRACAKVQPSHDRFFERSVYGRPAVGNRAAIAPDEIATITLEKLRKSDLVAWRERVETRPVMRLKRGPTLCPGSVNRDLTALRAALYMKLAPGQKDTDAAWQEALKKYGKIDVANPRTRDLSKDERRALIANLGPTPEHQACEPFIRALCISAMRPGILAKLTVAYFDQRSLDLTIPHKWDKGRIGRVLKLRGKPLGELLLAQCKNKTPAAPIFAQADGSRWTAEKWRYPIKVAARAAGLSDPEEICAYTLRHAAISDLVAGGVDLVTVALFAGTSVKEIEETYAKHRPDTTAEAFKALAL